MNKTIMRSVLSLALCLAVCASLFCMPAFAAGNTLVIIGGKVDQAEAKEPSAAVVVSGGSSVGTGSNSGSGIAADGPAATQVIVGNKADSSAGNTAPASAFVVQPDGTIVAVGQQQTASQNEAAAATVPAAAATATTEPTGLAAELLAKVNAARAEKGVGALKYSAALQSIADTRVKESVVSFGHTRPDGSHCSTAVTVDWNVTGENLIQVTSAYATADLMMETWMNSPTHKYNILLDKFTDMAVGVWETNDTTFVSLIFIG